jgi:hypothetical protein
LRSVQTRVEGLNLGNSVYHPSRSH